MRFGERMWWIFEIYVYGFEWSNYLPTAGDDIFECCSLMCKHIVFIATAIVIVSFTLPNRFWRFNVRRRRSCLVNTWFTIVIVFGNIGFFMLWNKKPDSYRERGSFDFSWVDMFWGYLYIMAFYVRGNADSCLVNTWFAIVIVVGNIGFYVV